MATMRIRVVAAAVLAALWFAAVMHPLAEGASPASLPGLPQTAGPSLLRMPLTLAPELTNAGRWRATPILVSGATAYRGGEFLYQDFLYDDSGANGNVPTPDLETLNRFASSYNGTYRYPTAA